MLDNRLGRHQLTRTLSTKLFPRTLGEMFDWADWLWMHKGTYSQALINAVRYFLGDISVSSEDPAKGGTEEREKISVDLVDGYGIFNLLGKAGDEYVQWGNSFASCAPEISRVFICRGCGASYPAREAANISYVKSSFHGTCPVCDRSGELDHVDRVNKEAPLNVTFWNPRLIDIDYCPSTKRCEYYLNPSREWRESFSENNQLFLTTTRQEFLDAIAADSRIKLDNDFFIHLKTPLPSTLEDVMRGWGVPLFISSFEKVIEIMMLGRYNEALLYDYLIPFRVISPPGTNEGVRGEPMLTMNLGDFREQSMQMISNHRSNPTNIQVSPAPINYQVLGGEARDLIPIEIQDRCLNDLLSSMCIPIEFREMTMANSGGPPVGLRRFEKVWGSHVAALDRWLQWLCDCRTAILRSPAVKAKLIKSSIYDDDMSRDLKAKLAIGGTISMDTGMRPLGIDYELEQVKKRDEEARQLEMDMEFQRQMEARQELQGVMSEAPPGVEAIMRQRQQAEEGMGQLPNPAQPAASSGGGQAADVEQLWGQAEEMASQIITAPPEERRSMLINLSKQNPQMHAFVKKIIEQQEQAAGQQGKAALRQGQM